MAIRSVKIVDKLIICWYASICVF